MHAPFNTLIVFYLQFSVYILFLKEKNQKNFCAKLRFAFIFSIARFSGIVNRFFPGTFGFSPGFGERNGENRSGPASHTGKTNKNILYFTLVCDKIYTEKDNLGANLLVEEVIT